MPNPDSTLTVHMNGTALGENQQWIGSENVDTKTTSVLIFNE